MNVSSSVCLHRRRRAGLIVACIVFLPLISNSITTTLSAQKTDTLNLTELLCAVVLSSDDLLQTTVQPPPAFIDEAVILTGSRDLRISGANSIIGYVIDGDAHEVYQALENELFEKGWASIPLQGVCGATFIKQSGTYTWMVVVCTQVGKSTSVVMQCTPPSINDSS